MTVSVLNIGSWWRSALLGVMANSALAQPVTMPATASAPAEAECAVLETRLAEVDAVRASRGSELRERIESVAAALQALNADDAAERAAERAAQTEKLNAERARLQDELKFLDSARTAWQAALDACVSGARLRAELERFEAQPREQREAFVASDLTAMQSKLAQIASAAAALEEGQAVRADKRAALSTAMETADEPAKSLLAAEEAALLAENELFHRKQAALAAERSLFEARLAAAREALGSTATGPASTSTQPAHEEAEAINKQRLAEELDAEARDRLAYARGRLEAIRDQVEQRTSAGAETAWLDVQREYWRRVEEYEMRQLRLAELHARAAQEKKAIAQASERIAAADKVLEQVHQTRRQMSPEERQHQAEQLRIQAAEMRQAAEALDRRAEAEGKETAAMQQLLPALDDLEEALQERLAQAATLDDYRRLSEHLRMTRQQLKAERNQIDLMITITENITFAMARRATLERRRADRAEQAAEVLVPSELSFWERQRHVIASVKILVGIVVLQYGVTLLVRLLQWLLAGISHYFGTGRLSIKRTGTLLGFAASIVKLFAWIFGIMAILKEFNIDPAKSAGAIGLIGLIMAGMFQQIVIDFVKGLAIVAGRHYNVGDFVEVAGKLGHVVDFDVRHTRIRTLSGQEYNLPNSQCVPSRRFPDGFVDNYVDLTFETAAEAQRATALLKPVCQDLNQRVEPVRDAPEHVRQFVGPRGRAIVRYRVRVLPGCDWVITDYFVPAIKRALADEGMGLAAEPTFFFINRIQTFRSLFNRRLTEEEILRQVHEDHLAPPPATETGGDAGVE